MFHVHYNVNTGDGNHSQLFALENALEAQTNIIRRNREQMERVYRMRTA